MNKVKTFLAGTAASMIGSSMVFLYYEPSNILALHTLVFGMLVIASIGVQSVLKECDE